MTISHGACRPLVLGIETSCDETAVAIVAGGRDVLANTIHSQTELHRPWNGVVPEIAGRSHLDRIVPLMTRSLADASVRLEDIDVIAVTNRPGLVGCLLVGTSVAKTLALLASKPLIGIDHLQAHVDAAYLDRERPMPLPLLALVASGGHTSLYVSHERGVATCIARSRDDAAGEALDKAASMLGLGYPGGPAIERAAATGDPTAIEFKRGLLRDGSLDMSFSGLKTALLYHLRGPGLERPFPELSDDERADLAASFQEAIVDTLVSRVRDARLRHAAEAISIGGGVARNRRLREKLAQALGDVELIFPELDYCSDNAAMIAGLGAVEFARGTRDTLDLEVTARTIAKGAGRKRTTGNQA
ncbi:MAG: tRNA (adenosine(37)-N6)-threonylcarbamoyltransferase complex transferase subunit TsaD [Planctomycetes bacterium]|nr:tRNA (adenosine(37)-N6)-threonylcarbamoyltransferase complex transferase subunit TsaD [Planctomycetota bacterium]